MITFAIFIWFTMKYVWPLLERTMALREQKIAEGLQAAERGHKELELAQKKAVHELRDTREKISTMLEQAHRQAANIVDEAKAQALIEREKIVNTGYAEVEQKRQEANRTLRDEIVNNAIKIAEKLIEKNMDDEVNQKFLKEFTVHKG